MKILPSFIQLDFIKLSTNLWMISSVSWKKNSIFLSFFYLYQLWRSSFSLREYFSGKNYLIPSTSRKEIENSSWIAFQTCLRRFSAFHLTLTFLRKKINFQRKIFWQKFHFEKFLESLNSKREKNFFRLYHMNIWSRSCQFTSKWAPGVIHFHSGQLFVFLPSSSIFRKFKAKKFVTNPIYWETANGSFY